MNRIPDDAFERYVAMGPGRSYQALAEKLGVSKRAIVKHAGAERWSERLEKIQREVRERSDKHLVEELAEMHERHVKMLRLMAGRAIKGLNDYPLQSAMESMRAAELVIRMERLIMGEPSERSAISIEEITRQEIHDLLRPVEGDDGGGQDLQAG